MSLSVSLRDAAKAIVIRSWYFEIFIYIIYFFKI